MKTGYKKAVYSVIILVLFLGCMVLSIKMLISHIEFSNSPGYNYSVAEICFDIGGAGYIGDFYLIDKRRVIHRIYNTKCNTPGTVTWISENEFYIDNRSGRHHFQVTENGLDELLVNY